MAGAGLVMAACAATPTFLPTPGAGSAAEEARALAFFHARADRIRRAAERRVGAVGARLLPTMGPAAPVGFQLLDSSEVNAYTRGGTIYVTLGMVRFARRDDELALVLGHELGHLVAERDGGGAVPPGDRERMADFQGLIGLHRAGYDIVAACEVWRRMATELAVRPEDGSPGGSARWASSHPSFAERYLRARRLAESLRNGGAPPAPTAQPDGSPPRPGSTHTLR